MTVQRLRDLLNKEIEKGNGHMPVGLTINNFGVEISAGLFSQAKIGVTEKWDTVWIVGQGGKELCLKKIDKSRNF